MDAFPPLAVCTVVFGTMTTEPQEGDFQVRSGSNHVIPVWWLQQKGCTFNLGQTVQGNSNSLYCFGGCLDYPDQQLE